MLCCFSHLLSSYCSGSSGSSICRGLTSASMTGIPATFTILIIEYQMAFVLSTRPVTRAIPSGINEKLDRVLSLLIRVLVRSCRIGFLLIWGGRGFLFQLSLSMSIRVWPLLAPRAPLSLGLPPSRLSCYSLPSRWFDQGWGQSIHMI